MPAFILISGYLAKGYVKADGTIKWQRLFSYILYYSVAQIGMSLFEHFALGRNVAASMFDPRSSLWYLMCLIIWHFILPLVIKFNPILVLVFAIGASFLVGYDTQIGSVLSFMRVINHFPFFMIGYYFKKEWIYKIKDAYKHLFVYISAAILFFYVFGIQFIESKVSQGIIISSQNYYQCKLFIFKEWPLMWVNRAIYLLLALVICAAFMILVPRVKTFFTRFGSRSLQVYILHRYPYMADRTFAWTAQHASFKGFLVMLAISIIMTFLLSLRIFQIPFEAIGKIKLSCFASKEEIGK